MFTKSDTNEENKKIDELIQSDEELRRQHDLFVANMGIKQKQKSMFDEFILSDPEQKTAFDDEYNKFLSSEAKKRESG